MTPANGGLMSRDGSETTGTRGQKAKTVEFATPENAKPHGNAMLSLAINSGSKDINDV